MIRLRGLIGFEMIFEAFSRLGRMVFLDAGATLAGHTKQQIWVTPGLGFTAFNLHPMGWANYAQLVHLAAPKPADNGSYWRR